MPSLVLVGRARTQQLAASLYRTADRIVQGASLDEPLPQPEPIQVGTATIDTTEDLIAFTGLPRATVLTALQYRRPLSFRSEWLSTPEALRADDWFYLSSKAYLFANATHFPDDRLIRVIEPHLPEQGRILDFGGGSGQLTLRLAGAGFPTAFLELNALQRDFMRFRINRHGLEDLIEVLDPWAPILDGAFAAIMAMDVIEHLPNPRVTLSERLLPALSPTGLLVENSPFVVNAHNPMHHKDFGFDAFMQQAGFAVTDRLTEGTRAWQRPA